MQVASVLMHQKKLLFIMKKFITELKKSKKQKILLEILRNKFLFSLYPKLEIGMLRTQNFSLEG